MSEERTPYSGNDPDIGGPIRTLPRRDEADPAGRGKQWCDVFLALEHAEWMVWALLQALQSHEEGRRFDGELAIARREVGEVEMFLRRLEEP